MSVCDMELFDWVPSLKWGAMPLTEWADATMWQRACVTNYMQEDMYTTVVVLEIPVQCNCL